MRRFFSASVAWIYLVNIFFIFINRLAQTPSKGFWLYLADKIIKIVCGYLDNHQREEVLMKDRLFYQQLQFTRSFKKS